MTVYFILPRLTLMRRKIESIMDDPSIQSFLDNYLFEPNYSAQYLPLLYSAVQRDILHTVYNKNKDGTLVYNKKIPKISISERQALTLLRKMKESLVHMNPVILNNISNLLLRFDLLFAILYYYIKDIDCITMHSSIQWINFLRDGYYMPNSTFKFILTEDMVFSLLLAFNNLKCTYFTPQSNINCTVSYDEYICFPLKLYNIVVLQDITVNYSIFYSLIIESVTLDICYIKSPWSKQFIYIK